MSEKKERLPYKVVAAYDTETCNIGVGEDARAYPVLFIFNDVSGCPIEDYEPDRTDKVTFLRHEGEAIRYLEAIIDAAAGYIPIVCAYNLMFDLQPLLELLAQRYDMRANAASSTNAYTIDLIRDSAEVLRFWDTFHLEQNGLAAMGETCGFAKATGSWDYDLIRTPETPLTEEELFYARRDVQVIPAYLRYLCEANDWLTSDMLGHIVITKTSLVRQMAKNEIGSLQVMKRNGRKSTLMREFETTCAVNLPAMFDAYAIRKACFRGGFTFTSAATASKVVHRVFSVDVTSMHHTFIVGRRVPFRFEAATKEALQSAVDEIVSTTVSEVLERYHNPLYHYIHACVRFRNIRLKAGSAFEHWGIALCPRAKFNKAVSSDIFEDDNERNLESEINVQAHGYIDRAERATFAFGKLYAAAIADIHLSELELWTFAQVYDFDSAEALYGEYSISTTLPPDYVALQSNILFERKSAAKKIDANYQEGTPYALEIPRSIPDNFKSELEAGTMSAKLFHSWYQSTVKGMFNAIYGSQAMDLLKPDFEIDEVGELHIDRKTKATRDNFSDKLPKRCRVLYTYGLRIVGASRMHLALAIILLFNALGDSIAVTGGDTDSLKISCNTDVEPADILEALEPLHRATRNAIAHVQARVRRNFPDLASPLTHIGEFEIENDVPYPYHMETWNKARASIDDSLKCHVTLAGVSRPRGAYTVETWADERIARGEDPEKVLEKLLGYNTFIRNDTCHALEHKRPKTTDIYHEKVVDYLGVEREVCAHESIALYPTGRLIGDTYKYENAENVAYLERVYGRKLDLEDKYIGRFEDA